MYNMYTCIVRPWYLLENALDRVTPGFKDKPECIKHMCARIKLHTCVNLVNQK
jgi:hypothetical protein